jgi:hypothetical protein
MMKRFVIIALLALLVAPCMAMTYTQAAYMKGFDGGWSICYLRMTNITAYNEVILEYNAELNSSLNASEASALWLMPAAPSTYQLPEAFR